MSGTLAINIMLLVPAFRAMDNALAESSHTLGASRFTTLRRVIAPSLLPTIGLVTLLGLVRGVDAFEAVLVVGAREQIDVLGTSSQTLSATSCATATQPHSRRPWWSR